MSCLMNYSYDYDLNELKFVVVSHSIYRLNQVRSCPLDGLFSPNIPRTSRVLVTSRGDSEEFVKHPSASLDSSE